MIRVVEIPGDKQTDMLLGLLSRLRPKETFTAFWVPINITVLMRLYYASQVQDNSFHFCSSNVEKRSEINRCMEGSIFVFVSECLQGGPVEC